MRLWHVDLIPYLDNQRILGQHRECCALRGKGWGKHHSTVNYVFQHPYYQLFSYHKLVMDEMVKRGFKISEEWLDSNYRGKLIGCDNSGFTQNNDCSIFYAEHNNDYLEECTQNLKTKGLEILI